MMNDMNFDDFVNNSRKISKSIKKTTKKHHTRNNRGFQVRQQEKGVNFWETYAPVVNWFSIRLLLAQAIVNKWHTTDKWILS